jgi:phospholipid/cholesterol/gamma-HCH transport system substrate-binding protein
VTIARGAAVGSLAAAIVVVAILMFGGGGGSEYKLYFQNAGQLVKGNQVQVAGHRVGKVEDIDLTDDNRAEVTISVDDEFAPLHEGTTAQIRVVSLPSIANRNIALTPGPNNAAEIADGGVLDTDKTTTPVDLDQLFDTLDPKTRRSLQKLLQGFSQWYIGRGADLNESFKYLSPALATTSQFMRELSADQEVFTKFLLDGSRVVRALAERSDDVAGFVSNTNTTFQAIGDENVALAQTLRFLPGTLRAANSTFVNLRAALVELNDLTNVTKPVAPQLQPFFARLNRLIKTSTPTFRDFAALVRERGSNNDLIDLLRDLPELAKVAGKSSRSSIRALRRSQKIIEFIRPYAPDFTAWIEKFAHATSYYDANGHYARVSPVFHAFSFSEGGTNGDGVLSPITPAQRAAIVTDRRNDRRCPGAAAQPATDNSNPFTDDGKLTREDCDPALRPPGP